MLGVFGLLVCAAWPLAYRIVQWDSVEIMNPWSDSIFLAVECVAAVTVLLVVVSGQAAISRAMGLRGMWPGDIFAVVAVVALSLAVNAFLRRTFVLRASLDEIQVAMMPAVSRAAIVAVSSVCQELMSRWYFTETIFGLTGKLWFAGVLSFTGWCMSVFELYGATTHIVWPIVAGFMLTTLYVWKRSLAACIVAHGVIDGIPLLLIPFLASNGSIR